MIPVTDKQTFYRHFENVSKTKTQKITYIHRHTPLGVSVSVCNWIGGQNG